MLIRSVRKERILTEHGSLVWDSVRDNADRPGDFLSGTLYATIRTVMGDFFPGLWDTFCALPLFTYGFSFVIPQVHGMKHKEM